MTQLRKALLATHVEDCAFVKAQGRMLHGYNLDVAATIEQALDLCNQKRYDAYVIEANLGKAATGDITSLITIYQLLRNQQIERLDKKLISFTGTQTALDAAAALGITAVEKMDLGSYLLSNFGSK